MTSRDEQNHHLPDGWQAVETKTLQTLADSLNGNCYMGQDWERETVDALLSATPMEQAARALPAGVEPVGYVDDGAKVFWAYAPLEDGTDLFTATQVQAMGRVPPGYVALPEVPTSKQVVLMAGAILHQQHGTADTRHPDWPQAVEQAEKAYRAALDFAPRPPAAQEGA